MDLRMDGDCGSPHRWAHRRAVAGLAWDAEWAGILELHPKKNHRRTGMYTGAAICDFTAVRTKAHMEGSPAQGAGPSSGSLEIRVRCSRRKHSSETSRENISAMG